MSLLTLRVSPLFIGAPELVRRLSNLWYSACSLNFFASQFCIQGIRETLKIVSTLLAYQVYDMYAKVETQPCTSEDVCKTDTLLDYNKKGITKPQFKIY